MSPWIVVPQSDLYARWMKRLVDATVCPDCGAGFGQFCNKIDLWAVHKDRISTYDDVLVDRMRSSGLTVPSIASTPDEEGDDW